MAETLIDIDGSNIPQPTDLKEDEQKPMDEEAKIKKLLTGLVLTEEQQKESLNCRPFFMIGVTILRIYLVYLTIKTFHDKNSKLNGSEWFLITVSLFTGRALIHLLIGIPFEIAYGTLNAAIFYLITIIYPHIVGEVVSEWFDFGDCDPCAFALVGFAFANVVKNWNTFPNKYIMSVILFVSTILIDGYIFGKMTGPTNWKFYTYYLTCAIAALLCGFMIGFFWVFRNKEEDDEVTPWKVYSIIATTLVGFLVASEFSGIHISYAEYRLAIQNGA